jgi:hypothetical protein
MDKKLDEMKSQTLQVFWNFVSPSFLYLMLQLEQAENNSSNKIEHTSKELKEQLITISGKMEKVGIGMESDNGGLPHITT